MRVNFFRFEGDGGAALVGAITAVAALPNDESRTRDILGVPFRLQEVRRHSRFWDGNLVRIRMNDVPLIIGRDGDTDDLDLDEDEGAGEESAFRYDSRTQVLAIQSNRSGVSATKAAQYFELFSDGSVALVPIAVADPHIIGAIDHLTEVRKVHVRYAGAVDPSVISQPLGGTPSRIEAVGDTQPTIEIKISSGRGGRFTLNSAKAVLKQCVRAALRPAGDFPRVNRIDVSGDLADESVEFNLLNHLVREDVDVPVTPAVRRMVYADRIAGIAAAWRARQDELQGMFGG